VVEEAPGPAVTPELRAALGNAALRLGMARGYRGAGTVEFLVTDDGRFFFIEMNTRLQVEHPVTEAITGRDLVADQIRLAAGESLGISQSEIRLSGHAIEARLYAEDPEHGFLPATGTIVRLRWPEAVRVDAGVAEGSLVSGSYDPLLAKLVAHGATRAAALAQLREALDRTEVLGVRTNLHFLRWLLDRPEMIDGDMRTDSLAGMPLPGPLAVPEDAWAAAAAALSDTGAWGGGWRPNAPSTIRLQSDGAVRAVSPAPGRTVAVEGAVAHVDVEGQSVEFSLATPPTVDEAVREAAAHGGDTATLRAPMPGRIGLIAVRAGDPVQAHQTVLVLEAMKMEHAVTTPIAGIVTELMVMVGQLVARGELLAEIVIAGDEPRIGS
jgi:acetyl/propionyl-CoA carboxylase alpha subunit